MADRTPLFNECVREAERQNPKAAQAAAVVPSSRFAHPVLKAATDAVRVRRSHLL